MDRSGRRGLLGDLLPLAGHRYPPVPISCAGYSPPPSPLRRSSPGRYRWPPLILRRRPGQREAAPTTGGALTGMSRSENRFGVVLRFSRQGPAREFEDELPVRRLVTVVGALHSVGELAGVHLSEAAWSALRCCRHGPTLPRSTVHAGDRPHGQNDRPWRSSCASARCPSDGAGANGLPSWSGFSGQPSS